MFCQKCGKEIADDAVFCQFCGHQNKSNKESELNNIPKNDNSMGLGCLIGGLILFFLLFVIPNIIGISSNDNNSGTSSVSSSNDTGCPTTQELEDAISQYKSVKIIGKFQPELNAVYVPTAAQNRMSVDDIQTLGYLTACYSAYKKGTGLVWVDIYNYNTGKKIAEYSKSYGFKMK